MKSLHVLEIYKKSMLINKIFTNEEKIIEIHSIILGVCENASLHNKIFLNIKSYSIKILII